MPERSVGEPAGAAPEVVLPARVAYDIAPVLLAQYSQALIDGARRLDLAACLDFDSSLIGILLELLRRAATLGATLELANPAPNLRKLAELSGVHSLLFQPAEPA